MLPAVAKVVFVSNWNRLPSLGTILLNLVRSELTGGFSSSRPS